MGLHVGLSNTVTQHAGTENRGGRRAARRPAAGIERHVAHRSVTGAADVDFARAVYHRISGPNFLF